MLIVFQKLQLLTVYFRASIFVVHLQPIKTLLDLTSLSRKLAAITPGFTGMCVIIDILIL